MAELHDIEYDPDTIRETYGQEPLMAVRSLLDCFEHTDQYPELFQLYQRISEPLREVASGNFDALPEVERRIALDDSFTSDIEDALDAFREAGVFPSSGESTFEVTAHEQFAFECTYTVRAKNAREAVERIKRGDAAYDHRELIPGGDEFDEISDITKLDMKGHA